MTEYITPYYTTLIYNPADTINLALSLFLNAQNTRPDAAPVHITPEVIILTQYDNIQELLDRGFQQIKILKGPLNIYNVTDRRIVTFDIESIYEYVHVDAMQMYILDYLICAQYPDYKSAISTEITPATAAMFMKGLCYERVEAELTRLTSSFRYFDEVDTIIKRGQLINQINEHAMLDSYERGRDIILFDQVFRLCDQFQIYDDIQVTGNIISIGYDTAHMDCYVTIIAKDPIVEILSEWRPIGKHVVYYISDAREIIEKIKITL